MALPSSGFSYTTYVNLCDVQAPLCPPDFLKSMPCDVAGFRRADDLVKRICAADTTVCQHDSTLIWKCALLLGSKSRSTGHLCLCRDVNAESRDPEAVSPAQIYGTLTKTNSNAAHIVGKSGRPRDSVIIQSIRALLALVCGFDVHAAAINIADQALVAPT
eukprot:6212384-Pleurochrysis_carterae.AAC.6